MLKCIIINFSMKMKSKKSNKYLAYINEKFLSKISIEFNSNENHLTLKNIDKPLSNEFKTSGKK